MPRAELATAVGVALLMAILIGVVHGLWIPLWITVVGVTLCALETRRARWVQRRRHVRATKAFLAQWAHRFDDECR